MSSPGSPLTQAMQVPLPDDGSVLPAIQSGSFPTMSPFRSTVRSRSFPSVGLQPILLPLHLPETRNAEGLRHGSSEQVQTTIDNLVSAAIDPRNVALTNPLRDISQSAATRGRDPAPSGLGVNANWFSQRSIHMERVEKVVERHETELATINTRVDPMEAQVQ